MKIEKVEVSQYQARNGSAFLGQYGTKHQAVAQVVLHKIGGFCGDSTQKAVILNLLLNREVLEFMLENAE